MDDTFTINLSSQIRDDVIATPTIYIPVSWIYQPQYDLLNLVIYLHLDVLTIYMTELA